MNKRTHARRSGPWRATGARAGGALAGVIARNTLVEFYALHPETKSSLEHWLCLVRAAEWKSPNDVRNSFPKASVLNGSQAELSEVLGSRSRASEILNRQRALT